MAVVHYTVLERGGSRYTACSRVDPTYSTAGPGFNCEPCRRRLKRLDSIPALNQQAEMEKWVQKARRAF